MEDRRVWEFEESLWTADADHYREAVDDDCLMVVPAAPHVVAGREAIEAVINTLRWSEVRFEQQQVSRPQEGLIVIAYQVTASKPDAEDYTAFCTSTYRRIEHDVWRVVQHQQTPPLSISE